MSEGIEGSLAIDGGRFYKKHAKKLRGRKNMKEFLGGFLQEAMADGEVVPAPPIEPTASPNMAGGMKRAAMKRAAMKRAAMKRAAMKKKTGGNGEGNGEGPVPDVDTTSQEGGKKRGLKKRTPKYRKTGGGEGEPPVVTTFSSVRSFLNQLSSGGGKKKVVAPARRRVASPARRRAASPVRRRRRSASPVRRRSFF